MAVPQTGQSFKNEMLQQLSSPLSGHLAAPIKLNLHMHKNNQGPTRLNPSLYKFN